MACNGTDEVGYEKNIPIIVMLSVFSVIGVIGNSLIIYVYGFRFKASTTRVFILGLAIFDLITCVLLPYKIILMRYGCLFTNPHLARLEMVRLNFLQVSLMILPLVSVDRFRRICMSLKKQISPTLAKILIFIEIVIMASMAIFRIALSAGDSGQAYRAEAFISADYIKKVFSGTALSVLYFAYVVIPFCLPFPIMVVLYLLIGLRIRNIVRGDQPASESQPSRADDMSSDDMILNTDVSARKNPSCDETTDVISSDLKQKRVSKYNVAIELEGTVPVTEVSNKPEKHEARGSGQDMTAHSPETDGASPNQEEQKADIPDIPNRQEDVSLETDSNSRIQMDLRTNIEFQFKPKLNSNSLLRWRRMTLIFFLITVVYFASLLPFITLFIIFRTNPMFGKTLLNQAVFIVLYNSPYITNISNCFLYGFFDPRFRRELKSVKKRCTSCCKTII